MAEALWNKLGQGRWEAASAGSRPAGYVHPMAIAVCAEAGLDLREHESKSIDSLGGRAFDLVVTVCNNADRDCPTIPGAKQRLHWPFDDPAHAKGTDAEIFAEFERVRNEIEAKVAAFVGEEQS